MSLKIFASIALAAGLCLAPNSASAGGHLFGHRAAAGCGCEVAPSCGCEVAMPTCGCEIAPSCGCEVVSDPCAPRGGKLRGLFSRLHARQNSCCEPAPIYAPAPTCGCEVVADPCCDPCPKPGFLDRLKARCAARKARRHAEPTCGCEIAPTCGCEMAPSCGCEMAPAYGW